ncbi:MAG: nicotinate-nucleotide adenylyltransferase [Pseudomonadota bacterium]|uniref:nicotinate-nucleotide adenylyltransferase n=1 Tax=Thermomonas sp. TaxID=1971895 RepID=UPI001AD51856|nr:nicotinate-nucleotide adenylyltransferase [Xanthomonadales bacterium]MBN8794505.1 nicotinate-nucleotide adenylyltransferase [Stenotrophomonas nitritireducens]
MLRIYYGGSFDPVHNGHLAIACAARDQLGAEVFLLPAGDPPHKTTTHAAAEVRAHLLELAVAGVPGLRVDRRELQRAGPSYTVDTLHQLRAELGPQAPIAWLVGADSLRQLHTWHRWRALLALAHLVVVARPDAPVDGAALAVVAPAVQEAIAPRWRPPAALAQAPAGAVCLLPLAPLRPESSTELRHRIAAGIPWRDWVPAPVAAEIERLQLYRDPPVILATPPQSDRP